MKGSLLPYNLKLNCLIFFYRSKRLTDYIYTDIGLYCKLLKCIGQTPRSYKHYLVGHVTGVFLSLCACCKLDPHMMSMY